MAILATSYKLSLALLLDLTAFSMVIVVFFPHVRALGGTELYLGCMASVMSLIGLIWNPIVGSLGDTYGRKFILIRMMAAGALLNFLLILSDSLVIIFIIRILTAFCGPLAPILATAASQLGKEEQTSYYNRVPAVMAVGFVIGSLGGGFLTEFNNGTTLSFLVLSTSNCIILAIAYTLDDPPKKKEKKEESLSILEISQREVKVVKNKLININWQKYSDIFSVKMCFELGASIFFASFGLRMILLGLEGRYMGYMFTLMSVFTIIDNIILVKLKNTLYAGDKLGRKRLFHASLIFILTAILFTIADNIFVFILGLLVMGAARAIADSTFTEALMNTASDEDKGGVSGAFESITSFAGLITPVSAGILIDIYGLTFTTSLSIPPLILASILTFRQL